jgi:peptidoglycan lytic transglycosylase
VTALFVGFEYGVTRAAISLCLASFFVGACVTQTVSRPAPVFRPATPPLAVTPKPKARPAKTVKASYQGSDTAGNRTASGEPYDPNALTAASRDLPMGSVVKVTNPETGRSVKVRINDRGPFAHGRSLDVSKHAAEKLGITDKGVARVKVTPLKSHPVVEQPDSKPLSDTPTSPAEKPKDPPTP